MNRSPQKHLPQRLPPYVWITLGGTTVVLGGAYYAFVDEAPLTGRRRWLATSPRTEQFMGDRAYKELLDQYRTDILPPDHRASRTVQRVGVRIADASKDFAKKYGVKTYLDQQRDYTYTVVRSDMANAFVLPGNHVFVMTGLFKYVKDEDDLGIILGHEVAHNLMRHSGERMSRSFLVNMFARLSLFVDPSGFLLYFIFPAASLFHELPHSRIHEKEADQVGMQLAADACYDPRAAPRVFKAMMDPNGGGHGGPAIPEFLSTHPSHETRIEGFDKWLPDAMKLFEQDDGYKCRKLRKQMLMARKAAAQQASIEESRRR